MTDSAADRSDDFERSQRQRRKAEAKAVARLQAVARPQAETTPVKKGKGLYRRGDGLKGVHPEVHGSVGPYDLPAINTGKTTVTPREQIRAQKLNSSEALDEAREALKPAITKAREIARDTAGKTQPITRPAGNDLRKPSAGLNPVKPKTQTQGRKKNDPWNEPW